MLRMMPKSHDFLVLNFMRAEFCFAQRSFGTRERALLSDQAGSRGAAVAGAAREERRHRVLSHQVQHKPGLGRRVAREKRERYRSIITLLHLEAICISCHCSPRIWIAIRQLHKATTTEQNTDCSTQKNYRYLCRNGP